jgi:two-component system cell cycle sensor histidine kinase/response regulator CckA
MSKILVVGSEPGLGDRISRVLSDHDRELQVVQTNKQAIEYVARQSFDLVLLDLLTLDVDDLSLIKQIKKERPEALVIVMTGHASLESAAASITNGVYDYLAKPIHDQELLKRVQNALDFKRSKDNRTETPLPPPVGSQQLFSITETEKALRESEARYRELVQNANSIITERKQAELALRESEERFKEMTDLLPTIICEMDTDLFITYTNKAGLETFGFSQDDLQRGLSAVDLIHPDDREKAIDRLEGIAHGQKVAATHYRLFQKDGAEISALVNSTPIFKNGNVVGLRSSITDITAQERLEKQLQQAQKMEAIGTLAGGIAHDFNNLLMSIQGNVSLMLLDRDPEDPHTKRLKNMEKRIQSGSKLTSHLLGYARKGKYEVKPLDLNELVEETCETFGRTRKDVTVIKDLAQDLFPVEADSGQMEQVLMNLFVNAADAMPGGGKLILQSMNTTHEVMSGKLYTPTPGKYVMLTVTDTGTGMDRATMERIFDPFFTTKGMGRGTGLGLASSYGIIKGHGGYIEVDSRVGQGSSFRIFLPASEKGVVHGVRPPKGPARGRETVLLVDDEKDIREVGRELLEVMGYRVLTARDGEKAVEIYKSNPHDVDVVLMDIVMPNMGGGEAFDRMKAINPAVKVLLCSGFSIEGEATKILSRGGNGFIQKPFTMSQLSDKIRQVIDNG